jgi:CRISPR/Cas system CSM-associated protein Csm2 small subunit
MTWDSATPERRVSIAEKYGFKKYDAAVLLSKTLKMNGMESLKGYQLRYIYFLNKDALKRLTVPILPFSKIDEIGARMYKGVKRDTKAKSGDHPESGGAVPTITLQSKGFI